MRSWLVLGVVALGGCSGTEACALIGDYAGTYSGDLEGELAAEITENSDVDGAAVADFILSPGAGGGSDMYANGAVDCSTGSLVVDLTDADGNALGSVEGTLAEGEGSGDWSLTTGEAGSWAYPL